MGEFHKPVYVGTQEMPVSQEEGLLRTSLAGMSIRTDSQELYDQTELALAHDSSVCPGVQAKAILNYVTGPSFPFNDAQGQNLRRIEKDYPGDIYSDHGLATFSFHGIDKFGTLASIAYGIRSWCMIPVGRLGLHSALLHDREDGSGVLIVGKNRVGKSSIGRVIETECARFDLLSDDWSEVKLDNGIAEPISPVFSVNNPGDDYSLAFESFGKSFYTKNTVRPKCTTLRHIIELHDTQASTDENFLIRSLSHIPFLPQSIDESMFTDSSGNHEEIIAKIRARRASIISAYGELTDDHETTVVINDPRYSSLRDSSERVKEAITK